jgi:membrane associated rhomboid family serine protease
MIVFVSLAGVGASGALYGLMLFLIVDRLIAMQTNPDRRLFIFMQFVLLVLFPFVINIPLFFMFNIVHSAHFGGGLVGFLCGVCMLGCPCPWNNEHCISRTACRRIAFVFLFLYFIITLTIFFLIDAPIVDLSWYKSGLRIGGNGTIYSSNIV